MDERTRWTAARFAGQALFMARFLLQWLASERARGSVFPVSFGHPSLLGAPVPLAHALYRRDPEFVGAQGAGKAGYW